MDHDHGEASGAHGCAVYWRKVPSGDVGKPIPYAGFADFEDCARGVRSNCAVEPSARIVREGGEWIWLIGQGRGPDQIANEFVNRDAKGWSISCGDSARSLDDEFIDTQILSSITSMRVRPRYFSRRRSLDPRVKFSLDWNGIGQSRHWNTHPTSRQRPKR